MNTYHNYSVMVVEDHHFQREYIKNCLEQIGIPLVTTATDGTGALAHLENAQRDNLCFDIIICDLHMPNMDGVEFIRHLSERHFNGHIIIITAMDDSLISSVSQMVEQYKIQLAGSLSKPIDTKKLISLISQISQASPDILQTLPDGINESDIIDALNNGGLTPYFQPKFNFTDKSCVGIEALARLQLPNKEWLMPEQFLYLYDQLDKTKEFELSVYNQAFELLRELIDHGKPVQLSVNFCSGMLEDFDFYDRFIALSKQHRIPSDLITIELTERNVIKDSVLAIEFLSRFRINGFKLSIDDFGTGYSSFKQLELLPFNELKIDRSFMLGIEFDQQKQAIVKSTIELSRRLKLSTVAEGIETDAAWDIAKQYGCDVCQGFLTGKPLSPSAIKALLLE